MKNERLNAGNKIGFALALALAALFFSPAARCADEDIPSLEAEIVITAPAISEVDRVMETPISTTVIDRAKQKERFVTLPELLRESAGVEVQNYGGLGGFSTVSIRGSASSHVVVMIDGAAVNEAVGGAVNLANIPVENVERIEVYRGGVPARFKVSAPGGAINIVTRAKTTDRRGAARLVVGSFGTNAESFSWAQSAAGEEWSLAASREFSNGRFSFHDDNGTVNNTADDRYVMRENNRSRAMNYSFSYRKSLDADRGFAFSEQYFIKGEGVPGLGRLQSDGAHLSTQRSLFRLDYTDARVWNDETSAELSFTSSYYQTRFYDPVSEIGLGSQDNNNRTGAWAFSAMVETAAGPHELTAVGELRREDYRPFNSVARLQTGSRSARTTWTLAVEDKLRLRGDKYMLVPAARLERYRSGFHDEGIIGAAQTALPSVSDSLENVSIGAKARVSRRLLLKANAARFHRVPGFYELFGDRGSTIGNTTLKPEKGENADAGLVLTLGPASAPAGFLELTYFDNTVENLITFVQNSQWTAVATNIGRAEMHGVETSISLELSPSWLLSGNYTHQSAKDAGNVAFWRGKDLPGRHERRLNLWAEYRFTRGRAFYQFNRDSANFLDRANLNPAPEREIHNLGATFYMKKFSFTLEAKNLTDSRISDVAGFPLPGKAFFATVEWKN